MAKYRTLYAVLLIGSVIFALAYESKLSLVLLIGVAILPFVTLLLLVLTGLLLKLEVTPDTAYVGKLQNFDITVRVTNRFIMPVSPMMITGTFHDSDGSIMSGRKLVVNTSAFRKSEYVFSGSIRYRGEYVLGIDNAEIYDLLRIFRFRIKRMPCCHVTVTPRRILLDETTVLCSDDFDSNVTKISFFDSGSFVSVREYEEGDLLKHVHWKLSAKHDELMVRQTEQNLGSSAIIMTDLHSIATENEEDDMRAADAAVEAALALTRKIIEDGRTALNIYRTHDGTINAFPAEKPEDYERLLAMFAVLPITDGSEGVAALAPTAAEHLTGNEPVFMITPEMSADEFSYILRCMDGACGEMRIYLTAYAPDDMLSAVIAAEKSASVCTIDADDVALSLRNSMEPRK